MPKVTTRRISNISVPIAQQKKRGQEVILTDDRKTFVTLKDAKSAAASIALTTDVPTIDMFRWCLQQGSSGIPKENGGILGEQLEALVAQVRRNLANGDYHPQSYKVVEGDLVPEIFWWCKYLNVNTPTFFRTLELFDRYTLMSQEDAAESIKGWTRHEQDCYVKQAAFQKPLRIASCIMLASKICSDSYYEALLITEVELAMDGEHQAYTKEAIADSELFVLKTLKYRVSWVSPFEIVEQMIALVDLPDLTQFPRFYAVAMLYLHYTYLRHTDYWRAVKKVVMPGDLHSETFQLLYEFNIVVRAAAIVTAASLHINRELYAATARKIGALIEEPAQHVERLAVLLMDLAGVYHKRRLRYN